MNPAERSVAIIGGGFTGAACAVHMARAATAPLTIEIVEPRERVGGGVAYGSAAREHRINVPSDRMSVFSESPRHFSEWLDRNGFRDADPEGWTPAGYFYSRRQVFGDYMADLVERTHRSNPSGSTVRQIHGRVEAIDRIDNGFSVTIDPPQPPRTYAAALISATHAAPSFKWPLRNGAAAARHLCLDPWREEALSAIPDRARVLILGTGLTMADVVVTLRDRGHVGKILAVSRRGLLPRTHGEFDNSLDFLGGAGLPKTALEVLSLTRRKIGEAEAAGLTWRAALDSLRRALPEVWPNLPASERKKALRFLRAFWDVHRYRMSPQVAGLIERGVAAGWFTVSAGRVGAIGCDGDRLEVSWTPHGAAMRVEAFDAVVNCTGPDSDLSRSDNPFFRSLLDRGLAKADPFGLGLAVDGEARVIPAKGAADPLLRVAGPLARGHFGEVMGLPEVSAHARLVAETLVRTLESAAAGGSVGT
jgi:uncharacterized NAD(P)/FAD-binding protein YdhS